MLARPPNEHTGGRNQMQTAMVKTLPSQTTMSSRMRTVVLSVS